MPRREPIAQVQVWPCHSSDYVVSTKGNKVMLFTPTTRHWSIKQTAMCEHSTCQSGDEVFNQVDTNLLSQAIKRLSRFFN